MKTFDMDPTTYSGLDALGRIPLSDNFHLREFLYSEISAHYGIRNVPTDISRAVSSGRELCQRLLEPLQQAFGRIHIRSGYRSQEVNAKGVGKHNCAVDNDGAHTWDFPSASGHGYGAMACISIPRLSKLVLAGDAEYQSIAWWIVDHLPDWSSLTFFAAPNVAFADEIAFNIGWNERPARSITTWRGGPRNLHSKIPDPDARREMWALLNPGRGESFTWR